MFGPVGHHLDERLSSCDISDRNRPPECLSPSSLRVATVISHAALPCSIHAVGGRPPVITPTLRLAFRRLRAR